MHSIYTIIKVIRHPNRDGDEAIFQHVKSRDERAEQEGKFVMETEERTPENEWFYKLKLFLKRMRFRSPLKLLPSLSRFRICVASPYSYYLPRQFRKKWFILFRRIEILTHFRTKGGKVKTCPSVQNF
jgi:hypothetical protein